MDIIKEIFYGNIHPFEREIKPDSELDTLSNLIQRHDELLMKSLNEKQLEIFEKFKSASMELNCLNEYEGFSNGFRLATKILFDALKN